MKRLSAGLLAIIVAVTMCVLAAGCNGGTDARDAGHDNSRDEGNLLLNPAFERGADGGFTSWSFNQHAGERSYSFKVDGMVLIIERVGPEPWGQAMQTLSAAGLNGRTLEFSAEVSGELDDDSGPPISRTGVGAQISGMRPGVPAALGAAILSTHSGDPVVGVGNHGWMDQRVVFQVPESATRIQLSLRLTLDGTLRVRNPRLVEIPAP